MTNLTSAQKRLTKAAFVFLTITFCLAGTSLAAAQENSQKYLFICAGDQARTAPDFLAVINFDESSSDYGKVIATAPLPQPGATGNEFHHIGLSADGNVAA